MSSRREEAFLWPDGTEKIFIVYLNTLRVEKDASDSCLCVNMASGLDLQSEKKSTIFSCDMEPICFS